jgi:hypothetical protein
LDLGVACGVRRSATTKILASEILISIVTGAGLSCASLPYNKA